MGEPLVRADGSPGADIAHVMTHVMAAAQAAGDLILQMQAAGLRAVAGKSSEIDLVTEADVAAEQAIRAALQQTYPAYGFWGEESNEPPSGTDFFWVVDPIDGTTNFANGLAFYAVNIALNRGEETLLGVTLELPARRLYWAIAGQGAYERLPNGADRRLQVNRSSQLARALLSTGFPYHRTEHEDNNLREFNYFLAHAQGVRCMGSAAMDLVNVARGALAGYWEGWLNPWDAAAGALLVREAGGLVTDYSGQPWRLRSKTLIASNGQPALHAALVEGIRSARNGLAARLLPAAEGA
ncbi:MAG TPA: inositol monophosphatase family protein [Caldilineaceae bacterium]|nr:inositol monophosphatase family protein [Caldilineaceae bacterium]